MVMICGTSVAVVCAFSLDRSVYYSPEADRVWLVVDFGNGEYASGYDHGVSYGANSRLVRSSPLLALYKELTIPIISGIRTLLSTHCRALD